MHAVIHAWYMSGLISRSVYIAIADFGPRGPRYIGSLLYIYTSRNLLLSLFLAFFFCQEVYFFGHYAYLMVQLFPLIHISNSYWYLREVGCQHGNHRGPISVTHGSHWPPFMYLEIVRVMSVFIQDPTYKHLF